MNNTTKTTIYAVLGILIIVAAFYSLNEYRKNNRPEKLSLREITQLQETERIAALTDRVKELEKEVKSFTTNTTADVKAKVYIQLAEVQIELKQFDAALNALNDIAEEERKNSRFAVAIARAYYGKGDVAKAKEISAENIKTYDLEPSAWLTHLEINSDLPNDQLKALYLQAIPATKSHVDIMVSYARFSEKIGDKATAIAAWETAINVDPGNTAKYEAEMTRLKQ